MGWFDRDNLRFPLVTETDADSPVSEELMSQIRENFESLVLLLFGAKETGSLTSDPPNDTTGVLTDSAGGFSTDEHNNRCIIFRDGAAAGNIYQITDTTATTLVISGTNMYAEGVRSGDSYLIVYNLKTGINTGHNHNGWNSETVTPAAGTLTQSMLKTSTYEASLAGGGSGDADNAAVTGGSYCFFPQVKDSTGVGGNGSIQIASNFTNTSYATTVYISAAAGHTLYAQFRYVTSSGDVHWIFVLRDYTTGAIIAQTSAPDHPCFGNGGKPGVVPHPFLSVFEENGGLYRWVRDPETGLITDQKQRMEILVINPSLADVAMIEKNCIVDDEEKPDRSWFESFNDLFEINESKSGDWPDVPVTVGLPRTDAKGNLVDDWRFMPRHTHVKPIKKTIAKPDLLGVACYRERK